MLPIFRHLLFRTRNSWVFRFGAGLANLMGAVVPLTFTRATTALYQDANYIWQSAASGVPRLAHHDYRSGQTGFYVESQRTNSALGSCSWADATYWTHVTDWTRVAKPSCLPGQTAQLLTYPGSGSAFFAQAIGTFVNGQTDTFWIAVGQGSAAATRVQINDTTASAIAVTVSLTWATLTATVSGGSGTAFVTQLGLGPNGENMVLVGCSFTGTASGTGKAGNSRAALIYPGESVPSAGTSVYMYHAQFEANALFPSTPIVTGAATATRNADAATITLPASFTPEAIDAAGGLTVYAKMARPWHADATGALGVFPAEARIGTGTAGLDLFFGSASRVQDARVQNSGTSQSNTALAAGSVLEALGQYKALTVAPAVASDSGAGLTAFATGATAFSAFGSQVLTIGGGLAVLDGVLIELIVALGLHDMPYMRSLA